MKLKITECFPWLQGGKSSGIWGCEQITATATSSAPLQQAWGGLEDFRPLADAGAGAVIAAWFLLLPCRTLGFCTFGSCQ